LKEMPWLRRVGNLGLSFFIKAASGYWNIFDPTNGFTAISTHALASLDLSKIEKGYLFEVSMLVELYQIRARIEQIPMPARYRGEISSLKEWSALFEFSFYLTRAFFRRIFRQYFWQNISAASVFILFGLICMLSGGGFGVYHWVRSAVYGIPASAGTVMIAAILIILGFQLLLQSVVLDIHEVPRARPYLRKRKFQSD
ncbi:MAG: glycosyltransferase family 2 protein, partial [Anaerolineae bacterium]|nr:glycosyltransferase family 2 protein [Anaerolineae bacterium]